MSAKHYEDVLEESFPGITNTIAQCETLGFSWESSKLFLKEKNGEIVSHVALSDYPMWIEDRFYKVGTLHAVCTKIAYRGQGFASELIHEALEKTKESYEFVILFTDIANFYEKLSFHCVKECRFHMTYQKLLGESKLFLPLTTVTFPKDNDLFLKLFREREPISNYLWVADNGNIASFNALYETYPTYWMLHYSPSIQSVIAYEVKGKTLHLYDVIARKLPSLDKILACIPCEIAEIYFYFSPDKFTHAAIPEPHQYEKQEFMVYGNWPAAYPFMIPPLSRC